MRLSCVHPKPCNKRTFFFKAQLRILELSLHLPREPEVFFECLFDQQTTFSKESHHLITLQQATRINEVIEVPFNLFYDRRKTVFGKGVFKLNIVSKQESFQTRLGVVEIPVSAILNEKITFKTCAFKIDKCYDKSAWIKISIKLFYLGNSEYPRTLVDFEDSGFVENSQGFVNEEC